MSMRYMDDEKQFAVDDDTGIEMWQQGRSDANLLAFRIRDPNSRVADIDGHNYFEFYVNQIIKISERDEKIPESRKTISINGYIISENSLRRSFRSYLAEYPDRWNLIKEIIISGLRLHYSKSHSVEPAIGFE